MKQEAAADALGVSQAYISRLEAGGLEPSPEIAERIDSLLRPPEHRAHFDHWRVAIRHCPGFSTLIRQHDDHICLVEISRGLRRLGEPFTSFNPGQRIGPDLGPDIARLLEEFAATGILEGTVGRVEDVWSFQADGKHFYFESVSTPCVTISATGTPIRATCRSSARPISPGSRRAGRRSWRITIPAFELFITPSVKAHLP
ncbi:helix-turn-helix domain-containing protein [Marinicauda algicola]